MTQMVEILQNIQDNLVGIILPVLITAFVSIFSIFINAIMQIVMRISNINGEQYKLMQEFYPKMKINLLELKLSMKEVQNNQIYTNMQNAINKYIEYKKDDANYIRNHENEIQYIEQFITAMDNCVNKITLIKELLNNCTTPRTPIMHFLLEMQIHKMLNVLWYYSVLWDKYSTRLIRSDIFQQEIKNLKEKWKVELNYKKIEKYIKLLDKWLMKY